ncbi:Protein sevenless [Camponotus floridanus]|uniref:Protein sevenless n=1 Tax=Camponotus floridanus TaxID=104421 RepID=E2AFX6_CAMFO|nr:Protein sevenless [Camponotus floridanus]
MHENPIPKLLLTSDNSIEIWDLDLNNITTLVSPQYQIEGRQGFAYSIQEQRIYWHDGNDLMTLEINKNNIIKIASYVNLFGLWIDWIARNLYFLHDKYNGLQYVLKFDLTMWENGISKFDEILELKITKEFSQYLVYGMLPSMSCLDNNLNKSEKFNVSTSKDYYEIQDLTPFTEYKLKLTLSNFYFDQLSINPFDETQMKTKSGHLNAPENISVLALTPTIAVVYWMPPKKVNCIAMTYEVHWKSVTLVNDTQQKSKQFINVPKRTADGRFFTKINLSLPVKDYLIYVRVYPTNFSDFYNESLSKIVHIYSEPNIIILREVNTDSMNISWISNINLTVSSALEYKEVSTEKWQTTNYVKMNYNTEVMYHIENLLLGTSYKFRLILRYFEYEETFTWPADDRFIFSTRDSKRGK